MGYETAPGDWLGEIAIEHLNLEDEPYLLPAEEAGIDYLRAFGLNAIHEFVRRINERARGNEKTHRPEDSHCAAIRVELAALDPQNAYRQAKEEKNGI